MLEILGSNYFIDIDRIIEVCRYEENIPTNNVNDESDEKSDGISEPQLTLNVFKFELYKSCVDRVLDEMVEVDEKMGSKYAENDLSVSFKLAFNTLIKDKIITEENE